LTQVAGQLQGSNRDSQSNCWAKSRSLGRPCTNFVPRGLPRRLARSPARASALTRAPFATF
jgi:hypothetical protein